MASMNNMVNQPTKKRKFSDSPTNTINASMIPPNMSNILSIKQEPPAGNNNNKCGIYITHNHFHKGACSQSCRRLVQRMERETTMQISNIQKYNRQMYKTQKEIREQTIRKESVINLQISRWTSQLTIITAMDSYVD